MKDRRTPYRDGSRAGWFKVKDRSWYEREPSGIGPAGNAAVRDQPATGGAWQDGGYVFTTRIETPLEHRNVVREFQATLRAQACPTSVFTTCATPEPPSSLSRTRSSAVSKMLGHSTVASTADVYAHLTRATTQRVAERMRQRPAPPLADPRLPLRFV